MRYRGFIGPSSENQAATMDQERTVNWYTERTESEGASSDAALYPTPGVEKLTFADVGPGRGHGFFDGREFAVISSTLYEVSDDGHALTSRGSVALGTSHATIASNGDGGAELFVTAGGNGYVYDLLTNTLTLVAALGGKATMGDYLDGYFIALDSPNSTFYLSDLLDGTTWDPTQFAQRSVAPDPWVAMKVNGRYLWLFGEVTSEVWYNAGSSPFPFAFYQPGFIQYGCAAPFSVALADGSLVWLGQTKNGQAQVLRASGLNVEPISTFALANAFAQYDTISDAQADVYTDLGHTFYLLHFPTQNVTWAYDFQTGQWAERGTWISEDNKYVAWRPRWHALAFGEHRMLDSMTGALYRMGSDLQLDVDERPIRRLRRAPALMRENKRIFYRSFELDLEPGLGSADESSQGFDPQVMLRVSNDGGKTWGNEMMRSAGKLGEYSKRVRWERLGCARRRVFEVSVSDPISYRLTAAYLELGQQLPGQKSA